MGHDGPFRVVVGGWMRSRKCVTNFCPKKGYFMVEKKF